MNNMAYLDTLLVFSVFLNFHNIKTVTTEKVLGKETEDFDFDGLPGAQFDFRIDIPAGREQCFHQPAREGAVIHLSFNVMRGGSDRVINVFLQDPNYNVIQSALSQSEGYLEAPAQITGPYTVCIDNTISRVSAKLVYVYLVTFVQQDWTDFTDQIKEMGDLASNFSAIIEEVQTSLEVVKFHQATTRMNVMKDWYLAMGTLDYIRNYSIMQLFVMLCTSGFTVYFVRRLFRVPVTTPSNKPRA